MQNKRESFFNFQAQTTGHPVAIEVEKAEGIYIYDSSGKKYTDMVSGIAVANVGHRHPHIIKAIKDQCDKYLHVMPYGEFIQEPQSRLAEMLAQILPGNLNCSYFVNSGTEANEAALKLAKRYTGRRKIVSCNKAYHGSTHGSLSVSGNEVKKYAFRPLLPEVYFMDFNNEQDLSIIDEKTAAVIIETIQGDAGVRIPSKNYMQLLRKKCSQVGALLILDEIQTGYGRTGKMFAFEHFDIVPDILTIAKSMAGGMPMGAFISSREIMHSLTFNPMLGHITTFGGHPVSCAAAVACLEVIKNENLIEQCEAKGALLESLLTHPEIREIRRKGLMFAIEFENAEKVARIFNACLEKGIITFWFLSCPESFRLAPPLTISNVEIRDAASKINEAIEKALNT